MSVVHRVKRHIQYLGDRRFESLLVSIGAIVKYFIDTEFAERPCSIDLISLAIVAEDGREFYAESSEFRDHMANDWVRENVCPWLWSRGDESVVFCWLFGSMIDLPKGWPMYCRDVKQLCDSMGNPRLPQNGSGPHHALSDARWIKSTFAWLESFASDRAYEQGRQLVMPWATAHLTDEQIEDLKKQVGTCLRHFLRNQ